MNFFNRLHLITLFLVNMKKKIYFSDQLFPSANYGIKPALTQPFPPKNNQIW